MARDASRVIRAPKLIDVWMLTGLKSQTFLRRYSWLFLASV